MKTNLTYFAAMLFIAALFSCNEPEKTSITKEETVTVEPIKKHIVTPSVVESERLGTLSYFDGYPSEENDV